MEVDHRDGLAVAVETSTLPLAWGEAAACQAASFKPAPLRVSSRLNQSATGFQLALFWSQVRGSGFFRPFRA